MKLPKSLQNVVDGFESLPGIGPKTAQRLAFYLLRMPRDDVLRFAKAMGKLKEKTQICSRCYNVGDEELCAVCGDSGRDFSTICVVESPLDVLALEKSRYNGVYHVLHGVINPMAGIGPEEIFIDQLLERILAGGKNGVPIKEIILATGTSLEGDATAMYINREIRQRQGNSSISPATLKVTRIGRGLPIGADIEYADESTLGDALKGRTTYDP